MNIGILEYQKVIEKQYIIRLEVSPCLYVCNGRDLTHFHVLSTPDLPELQILKGFPPEQQLMI